MKKVFLCIALLALTAGCNKKLKKEMKEMDEKIQTLESQQNQISGILGTNEPLTVSFSTTNSTDQPVTHNRSYSLKAGDYETQYIEDNGNGTYDVYVERLGDVEWDMDAYIGFTYNPTTGAVTFGYMECDFYDSRGYWRSPRFSQSDSEASLNFTVNTFNVSTGELSVTVNGSTTANSNNNVYSGKSMSGTWSFTGRLPVYLP